MAVVLAGIWTGHHLGGFSWQSNPNLEFNWHPLLMILGMIYLYGNGNTSIFSIINFSIEFGKYTTYYIYA